jgi:hypothetical protein
MIDHHEQLHTSLFPVEREYCFFLTDRWGQQHAFFYFYSNERTTLRAIQEKLVPCLRAIHTDEPVSAQDYSAGWNLADGLHVDDRKRFMAGLNQHLIGFEMQFIGSLEDLPSGTTPSAESLRARFRAQSDTSFATPSSGPIHAAVQEDFGDFLLHHGWCVQLH